MTRFALLVMTLALLVPVSHAEPAVIVIPDAVSVRLEIEVDGQSPDRAWHAFLDRLFRHFDRNRDGKLDAAEVGRMFPLPLPGRKSLAMKFAAMDADKDGAVSLAELKRYYEDGGFTAVVPLLEPATDDDGRLAKLLVDELDTNRDGKLSAAEIARFPALLDKYDRNDDERLRIEDLLAAGQRGQLPTTIELGIRLGKASPMDAIVRLGFGKAPTASLAGKNAGVSLFADPDGLHRLHDAAGAWIVGLTPHRRVSDMKTVRDFLLVQFDSARGDRPHLSLADIDDDPALSAFRSLFAFADRDGDGRLTRAEFEDYLDLIEFGVPAQVWITVRDHGRNPLPILDADGDGKLDVREVRRASAVLAGDRALPRCFLVSVVGPTWTSLGGVAVPAGKATRPARKRAAAPAWFVAMDRNGDGWISAREFLGPPELFRQLDTDGDGLVSPEEAARRP